MVQCENGPSFVTVGDVVSTGGSSTTICFPRSVSSGELFRLTTDGALHPPLLPVP